MSSRTSVVPKLTLAVALAAIALFVVTPGAQAGFSAPTQFAVGSNPQAIAIGDLNGDGDHDMVVANGISGDISILLGDGDGNFGSRVDRDVGDGPTAVAIGKFTTGGFLDIAVTNSVSNDISILTGLGDGSFFSPTTYSVGQYPYGIATGRFNADAHLDLAVVNQTSGSVSILTGSTFGSFTAAATIQLSSGLSSIVVGRIDDDDIDDIAVTGSSDEVTRLLGNGDATFEAPEHFDIGGDNPFSVALGDLNGDGSSDLVTANQSSNDVSVLINDGVGGFAASTEFAVGIGPQSVAIGKLTGADTTADLAVGNSGGDNISVLPGDGTGDFGTKTDFPTGDFPLAVTPGDLDNDGNLDLASAGFGDNHVSILLNQAPTATASPASLDFDEWGIGNTTSTSVNVSNGSGGDPLVVTGVSIDGDDDFQVDADGCSADPTPFEESCAVDVGFTPSVLGTRSADLVVNYTGAADSPLTIPLTGTGIDTIPPDTIIDSGPTGSIPTSSAGFTFHGDPALDTAKIMCRLDSDPFEECVSPKTFSGLDDGPHTVDFRAEDSAGNQDPTPATQTFTVDTIPPDTIIDSGPSGTIPTSSADFTFHGDPALDTAKVMCQLDSAAFADCTSPKTFSGLADGPHTVTIRAEDTAGNEDLTPASREFVVDTTPPDTILDSGPPDTIAVDNATYTFHGDPATDTATIECSFDFALYEECTSPKVYSGLDDGLHAVMIRAGDAAGNEDLTPARRGVIVDTTAPDTIIDSGPSGTIAVDSASFTFHGDPAPDTAKVMCRLDTAAFTACTSPKTFSGLADGAHSVVFRAEDAVGNLDQTLATRDFVVNTFVTPVATASISKVTVGGPAKLKKRKAGTFTVKITNSGDAGATGVKVKATGKGVRATATAGTIPAATTSALKIRIRPAKTGKVRATFKVTSANAGTRSAGKTIKVRK